jgi:hypothetical protein
MRPASKGLTPTPAGRAASLESEGRHPGGHLVPISSTLTKPSMVRGRNAGRSGVAPRGSVSPRSRWLRPQDGRTPRAANSGPIINTHSGLCLGIAANGDAGQWTCTGHADQTWHTGARAGTSTYYQLINGNGQCLGIASANTDEGARAVSTTCNGHADQYWFAAQSPHQISTSTPDTCSPSADHR